MTSRSLEEICWQPDAAIRVGVSSCLLGNEVRFDGGHKHDHFVTDGLGPFVELIPVCPEVELGMGIPRETVRLVRDGQEVRMVAERSGKDHTAAMTAWASRRVRQIEKLDLCGYILKKNSPSCGMERVRVYGRGGIPSRDGVGMFAAELMRRMPSLPIEEEGRLNDPPLRESFIERVFAYRRVKSFFGGTWRSGDLVAFHAAHKLQLLAHAPVVYRDLGRLVADVKRTSRPEMARQYTAGFMAGLARRATVGKNVNVLQHMLGYFRGRLDDSDRKELERVVDDYSKRLVPLIVPITLIRHHVRRCEVEYLMNQVYLSPHPKELMLRNHV